MDNTRSAAEKPCVYTTAQEPKESRIQLKRWSVHPSAVPLGSISLPPWEGRAALAEWDRCCDEEGATMLAGFSPDEVTQLQDYLTRIHANLRRANRATAPDGEAL